MNAKHSAFTVTHTLSGHLSNSKNSSRENIMGRNITNVVMGDGRRGRGFQRCQLISEKTPTQLSIIHVNLIHNLIGSCDVFIARMGKKTAHSGIFLRDV